MKKSILSIIIFLGFISNYHTQICGGMITDTSSNNFSQPPAYCPTTPTSQAYLNKWKKQSNYIPTSGDPVVTLKVVLHIFCKNDSSGTYINDPAIAYDSVGPKGSGLATIQYHLGGLFRFPTLNPGNYPSGTYFPIPSGVDYDDRWSQPRRANFVIPGLNTGHTSPYDSKIRYEVVNIYFYYNSTLVNTNGYSGNNRQLFINAIGSAGVSRFEEGLPVILKPTVLPLTPDLNGWPFKHKINYPSSPHHGAPFVYCCINTFVPVGFVGTLRHEMGHCFELLHPYYGATCTGGCGFPACPPAPSPESANGPGGAINCADPDFLSDLFPPDSSNAASYSSPNPTNCPNPPLNTACYTNWENTNNFTNNIMSDDTFQSQYRTWMSPLQMGRRMKMFHLSINGIRMWAKDLILDPSTTPWTIPPNTTEEWDFDIQLYKNIVVKKGAKLTIKCKVALPINAKILVEDSAQLIIDGGEITTWCKTGLWAGIEVSGTSSLGQLVNNTTGFAQHHGVVRIINGGKITKAENAIKNYITDANSNIIWSKTGGVIIGNGGVFENNTRDVEFLYYHSTYGNDASYFSNCQFLTTKTGTPFPFAHVTLYEVRGIQFRGCNFEYTPTTAPLLGTGILSMDAEYYIDKQGSTKTTFKRLKRGVVVLNANPQKLAFIKNTVFSENCHDGAFFKNMNFALFEKNELISPVTTLGNGLYLHSCQNYKVKLNEFHEKNYNPWGSIANGLYTYKSSSGAHEIYKNKFYDLGIGVNVLDSNSSNNAIFDDGLKINCNDFSQSANIYDVALTRTTGLNPPTVKLEQGNVDPTNNNAKLVVRNIYGANCNNQENQWYIDPSGWKTVDHGCNSDSVTQPLPQPSCSDNLVNVVVKGFPLDYNEDCLDNPESSGGVFSDMTEAHENLNSYLTDRISSNNNNNQFFEIQSTLASKINLFLTDTSAGSRDSVVAILQNYSEFIADSDIQLVFAQMRNNNWSQAESAINNLDSSRTDWAELLNFMLEMEQDSMKYFRLHFDSSAAVFLEGYANEAGRDGQFVAQNILNFILGMEFEEPRTYLESGVGERRRNPINDLHNILLPLGFKIYPNPSSDEFNISFDKSLEVNIIVKDLLGREILNKRFNNEEKPSVSLKGYGNGLYLIEITDLMNDLLFKDKLIKQD